VDERENIRSTTGDDAATESAALQLVLALHPSAVSFEELVRELDGGRNPGERDAIERAVRDLGAVGLLHHSGPFVLPTRAALRFDELMER
jgi:hypothetical protein